MRPPIHLQSVALVVFAMGCATAKEQPIRHSFTFDFEGDRYEIVGTDPSRRGGNVLILRDGETVILRATDEDQDGTLDAVLLGDVTLSRANDIYAAGIAEARARGRLQNQPPARLYVIEMEGLRYTVRTYEDGRDLLHNRFLIFDSKNRTAVVAYDFNADGSLDQFEGGVYDVESAQEMYNRILQLGMTDGKIHKVDDRFVVRI